MLMNFQQCRYVQTIAETGSFSKAAKKLFLTQPNLSASIRDLEEELGVQLFERSNTGAKLTDDGHDFLKYAKRILGELDLLEGRYRKSFKKSSSNILVMPASYMKALTSKFKSKLRISILAEPTEATVPSIVSTLAWIKPFSY